MKKATFLLFLVFSLLCNTMQAQFKKPLQSANSNVNSTEAKYNVGLIGGVDRKSVV